jgi:hypothetical protein
VLEETNSEWKAKSKVVLNYKIKHMNKDLVKDRYGEPERCGGGGGVNGSR